MSPRVENRIGFGILMAGLLFSILVQAHFGYDNPNFSKPQTILQYMAAFIIGFGVFTMLDAYHRAKG